MGIVGVGFGTTMYAPGLQSEGFDVVAICDDDVERAKVEADRLGAPLVFSSLDELLASGDVDAVTISTPLSVRLDSVLAALAAGKHVISEKPFALNATDAKLMADAATEAGLTAMVAHEFRFTSGRAWVKELIDDGFIGTPKLALVRLLRGPAQPLPDRPPAFDAANDSAIAGGGFLFRMGSHYVDALRHWFGEVAEVEGRLLTMSPERTSETGDVLADADDTFVFTLQFESGAVAEMVGARVAPFAHEFSISFFGSEGILVTPQTGINPPSHGVVLAARLGVDEAPVQMTVPARLEPIEDVRDDRLPPFRILAREFARGIAMGTSPSPSFIDGYRCMEVLDAVRESAATGRRVLLG
jgi:predicted dehydrogenase